MVFLGWVAAGNHQALAPGARRLGGLWVLFWAFGAQLVPGTPIASTRAREPGAPGGARLRAGFASRAAFTAGMSRDRYAGTPGSRLLSTGLRGKERPARVRRELREGRGPGLLLYAAGRRGAPCGDSSVRAAGFSARSAFLTSPTFGGISWLARSMQSGVSIDDPRRYGAPAGLERPLHAQRGVQARRVACD